MENQEKTEEQHNEARLKERERLKGLFIPSPFYEGPILTLATELFLRQLSDGLLDTITETEEAARDSIGSAAVFFNSWATARLGNTDKSKG